MEQRYRVQLAAGSGPVFDLVSDLATYPRWLDIVERADPAAALDDDPGPAWTVTLRARVGVFSRSKRLRMVRSSATPATDGTERVARFERREDDGRDHSAWTLEAAVTPAGSGSTLTMGLAYDGRLWTSMLEPVLHAQVNRAGRGLDELAAGRS
ncbi:MAG: SRPBCC family protein [Acidimicrobiales bacterium]